MDICIVGHGPSTKGRGIGMAIDGHDIIVRHVECDWQDEEDYGIRYDIGIFCPAPLWQAAEAKRKPHLYWLYDPRLEGRGICPDNLYRGKPCFDLNEIVNPLIGPSNLKNKRHFSRGTAAALAIICTEKPQCLSLVGFDAVFNGCFAPKHHPPELSSLLRERIAAGKDKENPIQRVTGKDNFDTHDWKREREIIYQYGEMHDVVINKL